MTTRRLSQRYEIDVHPAFLRRNEDAPRPGRILVIAICPACGQPRRYMLAAGRWLLEHDHRQRAWSAHPLVDRGELASA